ncbi:hypothetical protein A2763_04140 [Candidatus Kaiserbacteria bacterium RIFCSPHIGHO2_01_FULL_54_36]|uniref:Uncharacterized protein n=1 Tax=Candidatus Kaiserbacteria bacterium RIFCSPHIGHO2_01_FULL_54_36 TaxID=1798482 RepID=A0A1F6CJP8_9BACT|nr:MAG: hypothetical protein A2763_04140 [Candidatus Kaiserbacteria bacterium RIFCSPHIGHO2_01_FULL_54_36]OGG75667.1 MAG: hypothetical protein A3A41_00950 [Candidatus Kaiserbacteria bacterium RIFCSPLOWO2_01_FULL_54_22]
MDKVIRDAKDYRFWVELFGLAILFIARWPFTPLWKKRKFDYDSPNPIPKSEVSYWSLCALGALTEIILLGMIVTKLLALQPIAAGWQISIAVAIFTVLTGIRIYLYGRNEAEAWQW